MRTADAPSAEDATRDLKQLVRAQGGLAHTEIDQIARLKLASRRWRYELELKNANPFLLELIGFAGLSEVLCLEARREREH